MNKYHIIALIGKSGAGKDKVLKGLLSFSPGLHKIINCTTRPPREGEIDGKDYYFLNEDEFTEKILNNEMLEACGFRDWFYGTSLSALSEEVINIGVFSPDAIDFILNYNDIKLDIFEIVAADSTRLIRQLQREQDPDIDEIIRRYRTDQEDFLQLNFKYTKLINETEEDYIKCVNTILSSVGLNSSL